MKKVMEIKEVHKLNSDACDCCKKINYEFTLPAIKFTIPKIKECETLNTITIARQKVTLCDKCLEHLRRKIDIYMLYKDKKQLNL